MKPEGKIIIITGEIGSGKSTLCKQLTVYFRAAGWQVSGLITRGIYTDNQKKSIAAVNIGDGDVRQLASYRSQPFSDDDSFLPLHWDFDPAALVWGNQVFLNIGITDLLVVDELGPLEMIRNQGWTAALSALDESMYHLALLVMRPALLAQAVSRWPRANVITITDVEEVPAIMKKILSDWNIAII